MAPQARGIVPPRLAARLRELVETRDRAERDLRATVVEALKAGASTREVGKVTGLASNTVTKWGHEGGWPTPEQKAEREAVRQARAAARAAYDAAIAQLREQQRPKDD